MNLADLDAVLLDFGNVVGTMRMKLVGEPGDGPYAVDVDSRVIAAVTELRARGIKTALVSNNDRSAFAAHFPDVPVDEWFDAVVFSSDVHADKPLPPIYREALRLVDVPVGRCVFVDDLARNVDAAVALGMRGVIAETPQKAADFLEGLLR